MAFSVLAPWSGGNAWPGRAGNPEQALWNPLALNGEAGREGDPPLVLSFLSVHSGPGVLVLLIPRLGTSLGRGGGGARMTPKLSLEWLQISARGLQRSGVYYSPLRQPGPRSSLRDRTQAAGAACDYTHQSPEMVI